MQEDTRLRYLEVLETSYHGRPSVVSRVSTGGRGRPHVHIDPNFLRWAHSHRLTSAIT